MLDHKIRSSMSRVVKLEVYGKSFPLTLLWSPPTQITLGCRYLQTHHVDSVTSSRTCSLSYPSLSDNIDWRQISQMPRGRCSITFLSLPSASVSGPGYAAVRTKEALHHIIIAFWYFERHANWSRSRRSRVRGRLVPGSNLTDEKICEFRNMLFWEIDWRWDLKVGDAVVWKAVWLFFCHLKFVWVHEIVIFTH